MIEELAELKRHLERLERKVDFVFRHLHVEYVESDLPSYMLEATTLIRNSRNDEAVKMIREYTAVGIAEARAQVEQIQRNLGMN